MKINSTTAISVAAETSTAVGENRVFAQPQ
jgi:hypothetical protein